MRKKILLGIITGFLICFGLVIIFLGQMYFTIKGVASAGEKLAFSIINNQPESFRPNYDFWQKNFKRLRKRIFEFDSLTRGFLNQKYQVRKYLEIGDKFSLFLPELVAEKGQKTYFILLQNNRELRPTGGFLGSYAKLKFKKGGLAEVLIQDIYVPDGQISGHVEPPWPIQEAFKQGFWKLRDANWDPDFPQASKTIDWFFQKGNEERSDGIIAVNLLTVQKILKVFGSFYLVDYRQNVDAENLYQMVQYHAQTDFFPGSTQKKDILSALGRALLEKFKQVSRKDILELLPILYQDLEGKQILIFFNESHLAAVFDKLGWNGAMRRLEPSTENFFNDYLLLVEANLGVNKANCCVERRVRQEVFLSDDGRVKEKLKIDYQNSSQSEQAEPSESFGGSYYNFLRVYLPIGSKLISVRVGDEQISKEKILLEKKENLGLQGVGFFVNVPPVSARSVEVNYESPFSVPRPGGKFIYHLTIQKQSGIESYPYSLMITTNNDNEGGYQIEKGIFKDEKIIVPLVYNETRPTP